MFFSSWLRKSKQLSRRTQQAFSRPTRRRFRPLIEFLEDRAVPAQFSVTTPLDVIDANDGLLSLREAVLAANAAQGATKIVVPAGTYNLTIAGANEDAGATGDLDLNGHITIEGAGAGATVIDGGGRDRVLHIHRGADVSIYGVTIQGGAATNIGGGILNHDAELTISNSDISRNRAGFLFQVGVGAGIMNLAFSTLRVIDCTISDNFTSTGSGGGIHNDGRLMVRGTTLSGNTASTGGGILNSGSEAAVNESTFTGNAAFRGGAVFTSTPMTIQNSSFISNSANQGGGIYIFVRCSVTVRDSLFSGNSATLGGAIFNWSGNVTINNSNLTGNSALQGGAIYSQSDNSDLFGSVTVHNSTLSENSASEGGGIYNKKFGTVTIADSYLFNNTAESGGGVFNVGTLTVRNSELVGSAAILGDDVYNFFGDVSVYDSVIGDLYDA